MIDLHGYGPQILEGAWLTILVAFLSLFVALALGMMGALAKMSKSRVARFIGTLYTTVIRGVPDLVLMLIIFFGGQMLINMFSDWLWEAFEIDFFINIDEFTAGVLTIGFIFGAYMAETFRGAFMSVDVGQIEAGKAYGMRPGQIFKRIMFPQMVRHALPGLSNNWLVLLKTTALVSVIGLTDMTRIAKEASAATREPFIFFVPVAIIYLLITFMSEVGFKWVERKYSSGVVRG